MVLRVARSQERAAEVGDAGLAVALAERALAHAEATGHGAREARRSLRAARHRADQIRFTI